MRLKRLFAATLVTLTAAVSAAVVSPAPAFAAVTDGAVFNDPGDPAKYYAIRDHIRSLIDGAAVGSEIRISMYNFSEQAVADNLVAAKGRGVNVKVVVDSVSAATAPVASLKTALGTTTTAASYIKICTTGAACIGSQGTPINHNKFFLFSNTSGSTNVVVQSSANLTTSNATVFWNNAVTLVGNAGLYNAFVKYHKDLTASVKTNDYYNSTLSGNAKTYFFPRAGTDKTTDTIYNMLNENITCEGNDTVGTSDSHRTIIRVAMWTFTRGAIAQQLRALADKKCWIAVVYTDADADVLAALRNHARIELYQTPDTGDFVHSKYMAIEGIYTDIKDSKWVMTGSHNYTNAALRENDETMLRIRSDAIFDQYRANFRVLRDHANADPQSQPALDYKAGS
ncbi:phospholipase D-like domain-containing protein [Actinoplanes sp. HUAS TT8]|uniref:phospholipase D-like domain-containing protein n=1 Tax=Actinoplanes sp. HUAS TT8 TaxID=3447453 RepID=UPI003F522323